jgi:hypothetical protein
MALSKIYIFKRYTIFMANKSIKDRRKRYSRRKKGLKKHVSVRRKRNKSMKVMIGGKTTYFK